MKVTLFTLIGLLLFISTPLPAQEEENAEEPKERNFQYGGIGNLNFSYTDFGEYYSGGGLGNFNIGALVDLYSTTKLEENSNSTWDNNLRLNYGMVKIENTNDEKFTKSSDDLDFVSKYGKSVKNSEALFYTIAFNLQSQLTDTRTAYDEDTKEYTQLIGEQGAEFGTIQSSFLAPADISLGIGIEYKPNNNFSFFMGPMSGKIRVIADEQIAMAGLFGNEVTYNDAGMITDFEYTRLEAGANVLSNYNNKFLEKDRLSFSTNLRLFSNYFDKPENIDINWNTLTSLNPWKFFTINYSTNLAYDHNKTFTAYANGEEIEDGPNMGVQFKNVLGLGMTYKINEKLKKKNIKTERILFVLNKSNTALSYN